jgi:membrane protein
VAYPLRLKEAWNWGGLTFRQLLMRTWRKINENEILTRASAVSFYAMLALVPMLALILAVLIHFLPDLSQPGGTSVGIGNMTVAQLEASLRQVLPEEGYKVVAEQIARMQKNPPFGLLSIGLVLALWTASSLFLEIMAAMNRVFGVVETRSFLRLRLTAIIMTLIQAGILLGALAAIVAGPELLQKMGMRGGSALTAVVLQWIVVVLMVLFSFALTFYVSADAQQRWEWLTPGSLLGTFAFLVFTFVFRVYVQNYAGYDKTYGSLGGVMVLLLWFWVSSVVLLAAGQMNKVIENASPLGKGPGQKQDASTPPDLSTIPPKALSEGTP